jgi:hypothetical protein
VVAFTRGQLVVAVAVQLTSPHVRSARILGRDDVFDKFSVSQSGDSGNSVIAGHYVVDYNKNDRYGEHVLFQISGV